MLFPTEMSFGTCGTSGCHVRCLAIILELLSHRRSTTLSLKICPLYSGVGWDGQRCSKPT